MDVLVFLSSYGGVNALHSFPTRRSSDLALRRRGMALGASLENTLVIRDAGFRNPPRFRSEEHTSELQSLTNLVCRLLLEQRKSHYNPILTHFATYLPADVRVPAGYL